MKYLFFLLILLPMIGIGQGIKHYYNDRFQFSINYPTNFTVGKAPANNDGRTFYSNDRKGKISCAGHYFSSSSLQEEFTEYSQGIAINYKTIRSNFFAFSGYTSDGKIYYQKSILKKVPDEDTYVLASVWVTYPANKKKYYNNICNMVAASLR